MLVGDLGHHLDLAVQVGAAIVHRAAPVDQDGVADAHGQQQASHCYSGSAGAGDHHGQIAQLFARQTAGVDHGGSCDDGSAVLIVVEDGDVAHFLQAALDLKAAGGGDVLQVDAAKGTGQQANGVDDVIHIFAADAQGEGIHIGKSLEQGAFALHHRHAGFRADIA